MVHATAGAPAASARFSIFSVCGHSWRAYNWNQTGSPGRAALMSSIEVVATVESICR
jgi:hypothetical protein